MFNAKPGCMLFKQGSFITGAGFFPKNVQSNLPENVGVFYFPPAQAGGEKPILGGGDMAVLLKNTAGARAVMKMLGDKSIGEKAMGTSFLSPHKDFDVTKYQGAGRPGSRQDHLFVVDLPLRRLRPDARRGRRGHLLEGHDLLDQRPGELDTALKNIDSSWPS